LLQQHIDLGLQIIDIVVRIQWHYQIPFSVSTEFTVSAGITQIFHAFLRNKLWKANARMTLDYTHGSASGGAKS
jgi:hypothetical protein